MFFISVSKHNVRYCDLPITWMEKGSNLKEFIRVSGIFKNCNFIIIHLIYEISL